jgi:hypothetical protein
LHFRAKLKKENAFNTQNQDNDNYACNLESGDKDRNARNEQIVDSEVAAMCEKLESDVPVGAFSVAGICGRIAQFF